MIQPGTAIANKRKWRSQGVRNVRNLGKADRPAVLGDGNRLHPTDDPNYYFVRFVESSNDGTTQYSAPTVALSTSANIIPRNGFPVTVGFDGETPIIKEPNSQRLIERNINPAITNWLRPENKFVRMYFADLGYGVRVDTTNTQNMEVYIKPFYYYDDLGQYHTLGDIKIDLTSYIPAADGDGNDQHCLAGIFHKSDDTFTVVTSTPKLVDYPLTHADDVTELFDNDLPRAGGIKTWALTTGQTGLTDLDAFCDLRGWIRTPLRKNNFSATTNPTQEDDIDLGYEVGSRWVNTTNGVTWTCEDNTAGDAIWAIENSIDYNGFPTRADNTLTYDYGTRTITIAPTGTRFSYFLNGNKHDIDSTVSPAAHPDATNGYFFYYDKDNTLFFSAATYDFREDVPIAYVYYSFIKREGILFEERHGSKRNPDVHYDNHYKRGTFWWESAAYPTIGGGGLVLGDYTLAPASPVDADNTFSLTNGFIHDEDIEFQTNTLPVGGPYVVWYRTGVTGEWVWDTNNVPNLNGGSYLYYNQFTGGAWQQTALATNNYVNYYLCATTALRTGFDTFLVMSQTVHSTLASAQSESISDIDWGIVPFQEILGAYKITFFTGAAYTTEGKCRIQFVTDTRASTAAAIVNSAAPSNHNSLSGLQGGTAGEYYHLTATDDTNFNTLTDGSNADALHKHSATGGVTGNNWKTFYTNGSGVVNELALGTNGYVLTSNGTSAAPSWQTPGGGTVYPHAPGGRLGLTSGVYNDTNDVSGGTTLYYVPGGGPGSLSVYDTVGASWSELQFNSQLSISLAAGTPNTMYQIFYYNSSGTPTLELLSYGTNTVYNISAASAADPCVIQYSHTTQAFAVGDNVCIQGITGDINTKIHCVTSVIAIATVSAGVTYSITVEIDTTGLTYTSGGTVRLLDNTPPALTTQDGFLVKSGDASRFYIGDILIGGDGGESHSTTSRPFVANYYNRLPKTIFAILDVATSYAQTQTTDYELPATTDVGLDGTGRISYVAPYGGTHFECTWATAGYYTAAQSSIALALQQNVVILNQTTNYPVDSVGAFGTSTVLDGLFARISADSENAGYNYLQKFIATESGAASLWVGKTFENGIFRFGALGSVEL